MNRRCLIYCRVSDPRQVTDGGSLATQESLLTAYASERGFEVERLFVEEGESARTSQRTQLRLMMDYARRRARNIDAVLVYKFSRFARYAEDHLELRRFFRSLGIQVISISEHVDDTPAGRLHEHILAAFNQFDNEDRAENCRNGMLRAVREGRFVWRAPVGYQNGRVGGRPNIEPDHPEASLVMRAFEMVASGEYHPEEVRKIIQSEGLRGRTGKLFSRTQFHEMLRNPVYVGMIDAFGLRCEGVFQPLVSDTVFYRVQELLDSRRREVPTRYRASHPDFPLRGTLVCPNCMKKLTASWSVGNGGRYARYRCTSCRGKGTSHSREKAHRDYAALLNNISLTDHRAKQLECAALLIHKSRRSWESQRRDAVGQELARLHQEKKTLILKDVRGEYNDPEIVRELITELDKRIAALREETRTLETRDELKTLLKSVLQFVTNLGGFWEAAPLDAKQRLQRLLYPRGVVYSSDGRFGTIPSLLLLTVKSDTFGSSSGLVDQSSDILHQLVDEAQKLRRIFDPDDENDTDISKLC